MKVWNVPKTASRGYAIAPIFIVEEKRLDADVRNITSDQVEDEINRFQLAVDKVQKELLVLAEENEIFAAHYELAGDITVYEGVTGKIKRDILNAEKALMNTCDEYVLIFENMDDEYMRERAADMKDVSKRLLYALKGVEENPFQQMTEWSIIVAKDLAPSDTAKMDFDMVAGFITEEGGVTSHVSIIAKSMGIPCLTGAGHMLSEVKGGKMAVLDAQEGKFYFDPDEDIIKEYQEKIVESEKEAKELEALSKLPSMTLDGHLVSVCANVGNIADIKNAVTYQIDGVGLFRSEFIYMEKDHFPTEEEQYIIYKEAAELLEGKELTIRTLDIGGDKGLDYYDFPKEENPFLGYRAIRLCLDQSEIFETQLKAILRASAYGYIRIMYPMMISIEELKKANEILEKCKLDLLKRGAAFKDNIEVGIMIETPAAVLLADEFAKEVDFFSIGTNDLTQYMLAVDRGNPKISTSYNTYHPAVLRAIHLTIQAAHRNQIKVGMCGEFAGDEDAVRLLLGLGLDEFSMAANETSRIKYKIRQQSYEDSKKLADLVLNQKYIDDIKKMI